MIVEGKVIDKPIFRVDLDFEALVLVMEAFFHQRDPEKLKVRDSLVDLLMSVPADQRGHKVFIRSDDNLGARP
jgi:hypothetical protein